MKRASLLTVDCRRDIPADCVKVAAPCEKLLSLARGARGKAPSVSPYCYQRCFHQRRAVHRVRVWVGHNDGYGSAACAPAKATCGASLLFGGRLNVVLAKKLVL